MPPLFELVDNNIVDNNIVDNHSSVKNAGCE